jgi:hypothetical protein
MTLSSVPVLTIKPIFTPSFYFAIKESSSESSEKLLGFGVRSGLACN